MTEVINIKDAPKGWQNDKKYVYIGRQNRRKKLRESFWFNPFKIDKRRDRTEVLRLFHIYIKSLPWMLERLGELEGKTLVCWCKPEECHGDILIHLLEQQG